MSASAATSAWSAPSPSTAAAVAKRLDSSGSRDSRSETALPTGSGPTARTRPAFAASGVTPSPWSADTRARVKSGLPPVAEWQAATNSGSGATSNSCSTIAATASRLRAPGLITSAPGSETISVRSSRSTLCSGGRRLTTTSSGTPSRRRARNESQRRVGASAQWRSSTTSASGLRSAMLVASR